MRDTIALFRNTILEHRKKPFWMAPFIALILWTIDTVVSFFITGFQGWSWAFTAALVLRGGIIAGNMFFLKRLFLLNTKKSYRHLKTYTGYFIVFVYVFYNLPRMSLVTDNLITNGRELCLWVSSFVSAAIPFFLYLILWNKKTQEYWGVYKDKKTLKHDKKVRKGKRTFKEILWENTDAVISSIITVIIIQHFIFQLYVIPTESMVPTFLIGDRTFVTKFMSAPGIPLTDWKLPRLNEPKKGDIVVFQSPEYEYASLAKRVFQQFIFYITLTTVDIDKDEQGNPRKRFIVKRLTGVPGEKYMMVDDILYIKRANDTEFRPDERDTKYARYNLFNEPSAIQDKIQHMPINASTREMLDSWDDVKNSTSLADFEKRLKENYDNFTNIVQSLKYNQRDAFFESFKNVLSGGQSPLTLITAQREDLRKAGLDPFQQANSYEYDILFFYEYLNGNSAEIDALVRNALSGGKELDLFQVSSRKLNLIFKNMQLERFIQYTKLVKENIPYEEFGSSRPLLKNIRENQELAYYLFSYFDFRNFPQFPPGENEYIPKNHYFLIGDNRYNSLDFRYDHSGHFPRYLDSTDEGSIVYNSNLEPYLLEEKNILGIARATFWPFSRAKWHFR